MDSVLSVSQQNISNKMKMLAHFNTQVTSSYSKPHKKIKKKKEIKSMRLHLKVRSEEEETALLVASFSLALKCNALPFSGFYTNKMRPCDRHYCQKSWNKKIDEQITIKQNLSFWFLQITTTKNTHTQSFKHDGILGHC